MVNRFENDGLQHLQAFLASSGLKVELTAQDQAQSLLIHFEDETSLSLRLSLHPDAESGRYYVQFLMPIGLEIPDQHFLHAAQLIADFNQVSPFGNFSISEESRPYFDFLFQVPAHGECHLSLLEAIQISYLFAGRLLESLRHKLMEWVMPNIGGMGGNLRPQVA